MEVDTMDFSEPPTQHLAEPEPLFGYESLNVKQNGLSNETSIQNEQPVSVFDVANLANLSGLVDVATPATERTSMFKKAESPSEWTDASAEDEEVTVKEENPMSDTLASLNALLHHTSSRTNSLAMSNALTTSYSSGSLPLSGMPLDATNANACYPPFLGDFNVGHTCK
jgi:hypothetical protein